MLRKRPCSPGLLEAAISDFDMAHANGELPPGQDPTDTLVGVLEQHGWSPERLTRSLRRSRRLQ